MSRRFFPSSYLLSTGSNANNCISKLHSILFPSQRVVLEGTTTTQGRSGKHRTSFLSPQTVSTYSFYFYILRRPIQCRSVITYLANRSCQINEDCPLLFIFTILLISKFYRSFLSMKVIFLKSFKLLSFQFCLIALQPN